MPETNAPIPSALKHRRCSRCGATGHNARTCQQHPYDKHALPILVASLPGWIHAAQRVRDAEQRVQALITPDLRAAWDEQIDAMNASNDVSLAVDRVIRSLPEDTQSAIYTALREDGFEGLAAFLAGTKAAA